MNSDDWSDQSGRGENDGQYKNKVAAEAHHFLAAREKAHFEIEDFMPEKASFHKRALTGMS